MRSFSKDLIKEINNAAFIYGLHLEVSYNSATSRYPTAFCFADNEWFSIEQAIPTYADAEWFIKENWQNLLKESVECYINSVGTVCTGIPLVVDGELVADNG